VTERIALLVALRGAPAGANAAGGGETSGMPAAVDLEFRPARGGRGHHLRFGNRITMRDGEAVRSAPRPSTCTDDGSTAATGTAIATPRPSTCTDNGSAAATGTAIATWC